MGETGALRGPGRGVGHVHAPRYLGERLGLAAWESSAAPQIPFWGPRSRRGRRSSWPRRRRRRRSRGSAGGPAPPSAGRARRPRRSTAHGSAGRPDDGAALVGDVLQPVVIGHGREPLHRGEFGRLLRGQRVDDGVDGRVVGRARVDGVAHPVERLARGAVGGLEPGEILGVILPVVLLPAEDRADPAVASGRARRRPGRCCRSASSARGSAARPRRWCRCSRRCSGPSPRRRPPPRPPARLEAWCCRCRPRPRWSTRGRP